MDLARNKRWVDGAQALKARHWMMLVQAQMLGRFDCLLLAEVPDVLAASEIKNPRALQDHLGLSYLWVLGAYEIVRTIAQYLRAKDKAAPLTAHAEAVRASFERVRIPLAKFEPARVHPKDNAFAMPVVHATRGAAWTTAAGVVVSRADLADMLLSLLEDMARASS